MATVKPPQILQLTPSSEIIFEGPFDKVVTAYLELKNPSQERVCFKVKTTAPRRYCVRPNSGIVEPGSKNRIAIMLQPIELDLQAELNKHKFMVQSTIIQGGGQTNLDSVWQEAKPGDVMDSKLRCIFQTDPTNKNVASMINPIPENATSNQEEVTGTKQGGVSQSDESNKNTSTNVNPNRNIIGAFEGTEKSKSHKGDFLSRSSAQDGPLGKSRNTTTQEEDSLSRNSSQINISGDYQIVIVSLIMLIIGVILGKYII